MSRFSRTNSKSSRTSFALALAHFQNFLDTKNYTLKNVIVPLASGKINVYTLLGDFLRHLSKHNGNLSPKSLKAYMAAVRSYLQSQEEDIDISPTRFKKKVKMPKVIRKDEEPIDAADIREILLHCSNRRLKPYLLILASAGPRTIEAASLRLCELDDLENNRIDIRGEFTKTKEARYSFISDEAVKFLREWITWKYRERRTAKK
jgi:integrase